MTAIQFIHVRLLMFFLLFQEQTDQVRQEYDKILQQKLSEQYENFVKFIDHQIQQRFNESQLPSYLS